MKKSLRIGLGIAGLLGVLALVEVSAASADGFSGTFRGPHGQFSIHIGSPSYPVGAYAPYGYRVYERPRYGYGFDTPIHDCQPHRLRHSHWVPVRRHHQRWLIIQHPGFYAERPYYERRYDDRYDDRVYADRRYGHGDRRYSDRRDHRYSDRKYSKRRHDDRGWRSKRDKHRRGDWDRDRGWDRDDD